jgi:hypothetical protein
MVCAVCFAADYVETLAANGAQTATITNSSSVNPIWLTGIYVAQASVATNTIELIVTKDSTDFQVATISMTTATEGSSQLTHPIRIDPEGTFKVKRGTAATNQVVNVLVTANTKE